MSIDPDQPELPGKTPRQRHVSGEPDFGSHLEDLEAFAAQSFDQGYMGYQTRDVPLAEKSTLNEDQIQQLRDHLVDGLSSQNWPDLESAIQDITEYGVDAAPLLDELKAVFEASPLPPIKLAVLRALPEIAPTDHRVVSFLEARMIADTDEKIREVAARCLAKTDCELSRALEVAADPDFESVEAVRKAAQNTIEIIEKSSL